MSDADEARLLHEHIVVYRLDGALFFGAAQRFLTELTAISDVRVVILRLANIQVLDATGAQALGEIVAELESRGITVLLSGSRPAHRRILGAVGALDNLAHERHLFDTVDAAIAHAHSHLARQRTGAPSDLDADSQLSARRIDTDRVHSGAARRGDFSPECAERRSAIEKRRPVTSSGTIRTNRCFGAMCQG